jgi:alkaline phosphatase
MLLRRVDGGETLLSSSLLRSAAAISLIFVTSCGQRDTAQETAPDVDLVTSSSETSVSTDRAVSDSSLASPYSGDVSWQLARDDMMARLQRPVRPQAARNVIIFVADGLSIPTIAAARIYDGQERGESGVENVLSFETFPNVALVKTYNTDRQVSDSASTATALVTGVKTRTGAISVGARQGFESCAPDALMPWTLAEIAESRGMASGVISTARLTHATPATMYSHSLSRSWESDANLPEQAVAAGCVDIAAQLMNFRSGDGIDVILGGGRSNFRPTEMGGLRLDGRDLVAEWRGSERGGITVETAAEFRALPIDGTEPVFGLFSDSHMAFEADREPAEEPSLAEMTGFAIERLAQNENGYVLMVEAGRVDHAHHGTNAYRALTDTQAFSEAISAAVEHVDLDETLIVVTADHGHTMTFSGYPARGNPILGLVRSNDSSNPASTELSLTMADDGGPYTTLGYQNGRNPRLDDSEPLTDEMVADTEFMQQAGFPRMSETHSGADVALYAAGPRAHNFGGSLEQNTVFHLMAYALDWNSTAIESENTTE